MFAFLQDLTQGVRMDRGVRNGLQPTKVVLELSPAAQPNRLGGGIVLVLGGFNDSGELNTYPGGWGRPETSVLHQPSAAGGRRTLPPHGTLSLRISNCSPTTPTLLSSPFDYRPHRPTFEERSPQARHVEAPSQMVH